ncbi:nitroreductase family protein [Pseudobacteriovorax antillogorgiicola]|uniref:Nitroreductase n=1 Tax=Pseudobacteriovorax antillogorgiicola TaxID=1513793 RepID=A0A1Y6CJG3_9BACT|nr:nitroreductase family protein [Pseudobacteriovorax antillogorgiicola]TCS46184.1 nitroreductase [Pseudobacteriovorax antillogorgiicola]SMF70064.1 Nitroreductase [Pseudobacteriovorax antillogorgiicola]
MPKAENPLNDMQGARQYDGTGEEKPTDAYLKSVLPQFKKVLEARRSIRVYDEQPIPEDIMRDCLKDATLAPSSSNLQPYQMQWVRDPDKKAAIAQACLGQPAATTAGELVVIVARGDLWQENLEKIVGLMTDGGKKELPKPVHTYYRKLLPQVMKTDPLGINNLVRRGLFWFKGLKEPIIRSPVSKGDHRVWAHVQCALVAQTLMLSFAAHGYDSCPMGGIDEKRIKSTLDLPTGAEVTMVISAGKRKPEGLYGPRIRLADSDLIKEV